jgi:hypothetical protein
VQIELRRALIVIIHELGTVEMPSQSNVKVHDGLCRDRGVIILFKGQLTH